jgi:GntP family gluconate:H+ symporter
MIFDSLFAFFITLIFITTISFIWRIPAFLTLLGGAILYGLMTGLNPDVLLNHISLGIGKVFSAFAIVILAGAIISKVMKADNFYPVLVADIRRLSHNNRVVSGVASFLLTVPVTCCITAFIILTPLISCLESDIKKQKKLYYLAALGSVVAFALIYPSPVLVPLIEISSFFSPLQYDLIAIPLAIFILGLLINFHRKENTVDLPVLPLDEEGSITRLRAWAPIYTIVIATFAGLLIGLSHGSLIQGIMLAGMVAALLVARPEIRRSVFSDGSKHAGLILFDICGAGALGALIVSGDLPNEIISLIAGSFPAIAIPFLFAVLIQTAQGSRIVTTVITASVFSGSSLLSEIHPISLILSISAGACIFSTLTDPYFWIIKNVTDDDYLEVLRNYTLPLAGIGAIIFAFAYVIQMVLSG